MKRAATAVLLAIAIPACSPGARDGDDAPQLTETSKVSQALAGASSTQQAKLLASDGEAFDTFGVAVAVSGNTALIGAIRDDDKGTDAGAVYVFVRTGASWTQQAKLTAADGASNDNFGISVALSGDTALVGSTFHDAASSDTGAAYVFVRTGTTWTQQATLTAADAVADDQLGISVALDGNTAVVGSTNQSEKGTHAGAAYVFARSGTSWAQQAKLTAADGTDFDQLGISVAVSGDSALVGAFGDDDNGRSSGSAYVFARSGATWSQQAKLLAADGAAIDELGVSVALAGDTALVGAVFNLDGTGAAYVFVRGGTTWTQQAKLTAADGASNDNFGNAVALSGDTALIGAPNDGDLGAASGSSYVFTRSGTSWSQQSKLLAADGTSVDLFGAAVALSGTTAVIGAFGRDDLGSSSGAAYVFAPPGADNGVTCTANADCASGACTDGVCCNTACGGGDPNDCQACSVAAGAAVNGTCAPRSAGIVCRGAAGACDVAERCNGTATACPADVLTSAGTVCRAASGVCDVAERCTGGSPACPDDSLASGTTVCRPAVNGCDLAESCSGSSAACPGNRFKPDLSLCHGGLLGLPGVCLGGVCVL